LVKKKHERPVASRSGQPSSDFGPPSQGDRPPEASSSSSRRGRGGSLELNFSPRQLEADAPVLVFHHIRKTAGTSLRHSLRASFGPAVYVAVPTATAEKEYLSRLATWHAAYYDSLSPTDKRRLIYAGGHTAGFLIPALERPVQAFTMVREPVDHVLSRYFFVKDRGWELPEIRSDRRIRQRFLNIQSRSLLEPHFDDVQIPDDPDDPAAETWRSRLFELIDEYYTLGVQDRFEASLAMFQGKFGFGYRQMRTMRVNEDRPEDPGIDPEILDVLRQCSWLDQALYEHGVAGLDRYFADKPEEAQDPRRTPVSRREVRAWKGDTEVKPGEAALSVAERLEHINAQIGAELRAIREELASIRESLKTTNVHVKALERKQRGRDETAPSDEQVAGPKASRDKGRRAGARSSKSAAAAKR
jgi:hypothetical protein